VPADIGSRMPTCLLKALPVPPVLSPVEGSDIEGSQVEVWEGTL
jgi:hypothetical protein